MKQLPNQSNGSINILGVTVILTSNSRSIYWFALGVLKYKTHYVTWE